MEELWNNRIITYFSRIVMMQAALKVNTNDYSGRLRKRVLFSNYFIERKSSKEKQSGSRLIERKWLL